MGPKIDFSKAILDAAASTCHVDSVMSAERMLVKSYVDTYIFYFLFFIFFTFEHHFYPRK